MPSLPGCHLKQQDFSSFSMPISLERYLETDGRGNDYLQTQFRVWQDCVRFLWTLQKVPTLRTLGNTMFKRIDSKHGPQASTLNGDF